MAKCNSCGAEIIWAHTASGKAIPLDAEPVPFGNLVVVPGADGPRALSVNIPGALGPRYVSHFATCPNANQHRKPRDGQSGLPGVA